MSQGQYLHKSHNVSVLLYHLVFPAKYRRVVFDASVDVVLREVCLEITARYEITFLEIGTGCPLGRAITCTFCCNLLPATVPPKSCA